MDSQPPARWTFAARAAYFGDRVCSFCDHHNPAGAKFCNDCASPLHLKPCKRCDAINHQAATKCYKCGAPCPGFLTFEAATGSPGAKAPAWSALDDGSVAPTVSQPRFATSALRAYWRLLRPGQFVMAAIGTMLVAGIYAAYHIRDVTSEPMQLAS